MLQLTIILILACLVVASQAESHHSLETRQYAGFQRQQMKQPSSSSQRPQADYPNNDDPSNGGEDYYDDDEEDQPPPPPPPPHYGGGGQHGRGPPPHGRGPPGRGGEGDGHRGPPRGGQGGRQEDWNEQRPGRGGGRGEGRQGGHPPPPPPQHGQNNQWEARQSGPWGRGPRGPPPPPPLFRGRGPPEGEGPPGRFPQFAVPASCPELNPVENFTLYQMDGMWYEIMTSSQRPTACNQYKMEGSDSELNVTVTQFNPQRDVIESFAVVFNETNRPNGTFTAHRRDMNHERNMTVVIFKPDQYAVLINCEQERRMEYGPRGPVRRPEAIFDIRVLAASRDIGFATVQGLVQQIESNPAFRQTPLRSVHHAGCAQKGVEDEFSGTTEASREEFEQNGRHKRRPSH